MKGLCSTVERYAHRGYYRAVFQKVKFMGICGVYVCVSLCVYVCILLSCACTYMCLCVRAWSWYSESSLSFFHFYLSVESLSLNLNLCISSFSSYPACSGFQGAVTPVLLVCEFWGSKLCSSCLLSKCFTYWAISPSLKGFSYIF